MPSRAAGWALIQEKAWARPTEVNSGLAKRRLPVEVSTPFQFSRSGTSECQR